MFNWLHKLIPGRYKQYKPSEDELVKQFTTRCNTLKEEISRLQDQLATVSTEVQQYRDGVRILSVPNEQLIRQLKEKLDKPACGTTDTDLCVSHRLGQQYVVSVLEAWRFKCEGS